MRTERKTCLEKKLNDAQRVKDMMASLKMRADGGRGDAAADKPPSQAESEEQRVKPTRRFGHGELQTGHRLREG